MNNQSRSSLFGQGIFTTVAVRQGMPMLWHKHWRRLVNNAAALKINLECYDMEQILANLSESIGKRKISDGKVRITFSDQRPSELWPTTRLPESQTSIDIMFGEISPFPRKFRLSISPHLYNSASPLAGIKSCNYLEPVLSLEEAKKRGFHEAIRLNERGHITSACMANVFWKKDGELFTPSLTTGCLAGTTREFVLENLECREVEVGVEEIEHAEAIFLTSAGLGVVEVAAFNERELFPSDHRIKKILPF